MPGILLDAADADRSVIHKALSTFKESLLRVLPSSPLKPDELQVLRAQYEKEGPYVGVQTKFNFAWVSSRRRVVTLLDDSWSSRV